MKKNHARYLLCLPLIVLIALSGCARNAQKQGKTIPQEFLIGTSIDTQNTDGDTALILALDKDNNEIAYQLIDKGAKLDLKNSGGNTALIFAAANDNPEVVKMLIKEKAQLDIQTKRGNTALMVAAANGDERLIQLFIDKGARLDIRNRDGVTALDIAMKSNNAAAVKRLETAMTGKRSSKK